MTAASSNPLDRTRPSAGRLFRAGAAAAAIGAVLSVILFYAGTMVPLASLPGGSIDLPFVIVLSAVPPLVAAALLLGLFRFVPGRALQIFWAAAALVYLLFLFPPFTLGAPAGMIWTLQLMHLAVAIPTVWLLTRAARG